MPPTRGPGSGVLDRLLTVARKDRPPGYAADLAMTYRLIARGVHSLGAAMRFASLRRRRYPKEYPELAAEARGQGKLL